MTGLGAIAEGSRSQFLMEVDVPIIGARLCKYCTGQNCTVRLPLT